MASTNDFTPNGSRAFCSVCRNLDFHCPLPGEDAETFLGDFIVFTRDFSEFAKSADQGCAACWVVANIGRMWDKSIDPATEIIVQILSGGDPNVSCTKFQPLQGLDIYVPKENLLCQSRHVSTSSACQDNKLTCFQTLKRRGNRHSDPYG